MHFDAIVLGAGISGLVSASILSEKADQRVLLLDEYETAGGNHIAADHGGMTFDIGSFFFQDDSPLLAHFPQILPIYQDIGSYTISRLTPFGQVARYPVDMRRELLGAGPAEFMRILLSVLWARLRVNPRKNAENYATYWIGRRFADRAGLRHYLRRFYGTEPARIEAVFAEKRMGWIANPSKRILDAIKPRRPTAAAGNRQLVRPREGFGPLYAAAVDGLRERGVQVELGARLQSIDRLDGRMRVVTSHGSFEAPMLLSTIPLNRTLALCGMPEEPGIRSASLTSLFYSFRGRRGFDSNVLYNFSHDGAWKRLTVYSDFYGTVEDRIYFTVEVISSDEPVPPEKAAADFAAHCAKAGILSGDLRLEGALITGSAYPIYLDGASIAADQAITRLREFGVLSYGRQGGFDYQPTARVSTQTAEAHVAKAVMEPEPDSRES